MVHVSPPHCVVCHSPWASQRPGVSKGYTTHFNTVSLKRVYINQWTSFSGVKISKRLHKLYKKTITGGYTLLNRCGFDTAHVFLVALSNFRNISTLQWDETMDKANISTNLNLIIFLDKYNMKRTPEKAKSANIHPMKKTSKKQQKITASHLNTSGPLERERPLCCIPTKEFNGEAPGNWKSFSLRTLYWSIVPWSDQRNS